MKLCNETIEVKEKAFPLSFYGHCQKAEGHAGMHLFFQRGLSWECSHVSGKKLLLYGDAQIGWDGNDCWIWPSLTVVEDGVERPAEIKCSIPAATLH